MDFPPPDEFGFGPPPFGPTGPVDPGQHPEPFSGKMQAQMWQEQHYMGTGPESGFISGSTTQPSSRTGHDEGMEDGCSFTGPGSIVSGSLYDLDSAAHSEVNSITSSHPGMADPVEHIPQLVTAIRDALREEDYVVVQESLLFVDKCVRKEKEKESFFSALVRSPDLVCAIVSALINAFKTMYENDKIINSNNSSSEAIVAEANEALAAAKERARTSSDILRAMTNRQESKEEMAARSGNHLHSNRDRAENQRIACRHILASPGGLATLTSLLSVNVDRFKINGVTTIHSVLLYLKDQEREDAKKQIREAKGVQVMTALLEQDNPKLLTILCDCLTILAKGDKMTKQLILKEKGTVRILGMLHKASYNKLVETAIKLLQVLSICQQNKQVIIQNGGMETLAKFLQRENKIPFYAGLTMRNLSDSSAGIQNPDLLAELLVKALRHRDLQVIICAAGIISNLTALTSTLKLGVLKAGGMPELVSIIEHPGSSKELVEPAMCALRHLTNNHAKVEDAQRLFIQGLDGLQKLEKWVQPLAPRPCLKAALGIIRNLAQNTSNHQVLRDGQFVHQSLKLLIFNFDEMNFKGPSANDPIDGVKLMEVIEVTISCIYGLSKSAENRSIIRDPTIVDILKTVLTNPSESVQRLTCGILRELAQDREGAFVIHQTGPCQSIENLIGKYQGAQDNSPQQKIAAFAIATMNAVELCQKQLESGEFRPQPIQQHFHHTSPQQHMQPPPQQPQQGPQQYPNHLRGPAPPLNQYGLPPNGPPPPGMEFSNYHNFPPNMGPGFDDVMSEMGPRGPTNMYEGGVGPNAPQSVGPNFMPDEMDMFGPEDPNYPGAFFGGQPPMH